MADNETLVRTELALASASISNARVRPALPTTNPRRRKKMIPRMVKTLGVNTPPNVPSPVPCRKSGDR
jgi:hypothetical protein